MRAGRLTGLRRIEQYPASNSDPKATMANAGDTPLAHDDMRDFRRLAGLMVPASAAYRVPGADDEVIFSDIVRSLGRDREAVRSALAMLRELSAGSAFAELDQVAAEAAAMTLLARRGAVITALGRVVLQCYYRDDRVIKALGLEARPPFPKGHHLPSGDWTLLDQVKGRPRMWRDVDGRGR